MRLTEQQKKDRRLGIGASDIAEMMGLSPFQGKGPMRLYAEKRGLLPDEDSEETTEQKVGHALEGALVALYEQESGFRVLRTGEYVESVQRADEPWMRCNLDGRVVGKRAALEVKIVGIGMMRDWKTDSDDGIPPYVRLQCYWQMHVADLDEVHVVYLCGTDFRVFYVHRNQEIIDAIVVEARAFWDLVQTDRLPPIDGSSMATMLLERAYPQPPVDVEVETSDEEAGMLDQAIAFSDSERRAKEAKEVIRNAIRQRMGERACTIMYSGTARATWKADKNGTRTLKISPVGEARKPRITKRKANINAMPVVEVDDGEVF